MQEKINMRFEDMNELQKNSYNASIVTEAEGDEYGYSKVMRDAIYEIERLKNLTKSVHKGGSIRGLWG